MANKCENGTPKLDILIDLINDNPQLGRLFADLASYHGHAVTIQNEKGQKLPVRYNQTKGYDEIFIDKKWVKKGV